MKIASFGSSALQEKQKAFGDSFIPCFEILFERRAEKMIFKTPIVAMRRAMPLKR
jgi:hypothetical protein